MNASFKKIENCKKIAFYNYVLNFLFPPEYSSLFICVNDSFNKIATSLRI